MNENQLLDQIVTLFQEQTEVLTKMVHEEVTKEVGTAETRINLKIENEVTKRIDALFDGYKLVHEKQWELEHEVISMKERLDRLEAMVG